MIYKAIFSSLLVLSLNCEAQTVRIDSTNNQSYCEINPIKLNFINSQPNITRLYLKVIDFNLVNSVSVHYWLMYQEYRTDGSYYYLPVGGVGDGNQTIGVDNNGTIQQASSYLFNYIADSLLNVELK